MSAVRSSRAIGGPFGYRLANASRAASSCRGSRSVATYRAGRKPSTRRAAMSPLPQPISRQAAPGGRERFARIHSWIRVLRRALDRFTKNREIRFISAIGPSSV